MEEGDVIREIPENAEWVGVITSGSVEEVILPGYTESDTKDFEGLKFIWYEKDK